MLKLARPTVTPPGGYWYYDPDLDTRFTENLLVDLVLLVSRTRKLNGLEVPPDFSAIVEDSICQRLPAELVSPVQEKKTGARPAERVLPHSPLQTRAPVFFSRTQLLRATSQIIRQRPALVSWDDAVERVKVCRRCPLNRREPGCYSCTLESVFRPAVGKLPPTEDFKYAGVCTADGTYLKALARVAEFPEPELYPDFCWKKGTRQDG